MSDGADAGEVPQPEEIYERTKREGERRLTRPLVEVASTALAAGFDVIAGLTVFALVSSLLAERFGAGVAHLGGSVAFGIAFVFLVVGKAELFTENFLVPIAGLDRRRRSSWWALVRLWTISPVANLVGGALIVLILTVHDVLPQGAGRPLVDAAETLHSHGTLSLFFSAVFAGGLMTAMTWFVEGSPQMGVRIVVAWIAGAILTLGYFDHVIVDTLLLLFGRRFGGDIPWLFVLGNFGLAAAGNMLGGIGLVTLNRLTQGGAAGARSG